ncbi:MULTISPECIES: CPP1-like family protein [Prochlorococcus]|uniref:CPP1-like family protein n=1 Tax=Prochlorococcus TaxID=1218 RepID=UPI00053370F4|nr:MULTISPECIES: CPP1-like family protein [Prochlorococcus]KGG12566.1 Cyanobacteria-specific chaperone containing DNAJ domain fused to a membrane domain [Prochlorococcus sp. MIT 0601]
MAEKDLNSNQSSEDAYQMLGLQPGASFDEVQKARDARLSEIVDDPILKAKIESSYDALLMDSLKARQLGKVSNAAVDASIKEKSSNQIGTVVRKSLLTRIGKFDFSDNKGSDKRLLPNLFIPEGQGLTIRLALGFLALVLLLISPDESIQIILSLSTIGLFISQVKRGIGIFQSLGWSVVFLSIGLILGGLVAGGIDSMANHPSSFSPDKIEGFISLIIIWMGTLLLA